MAYASRLFAAATWLLSLAAALPGWQVAQQQASSTPVVITRRELQIPMEEAGTAGLQAFLIMPSDAGKHPLVIMTHGTNIGSGSNHDMGPGSLQPQALWFARRGYAVAIVVRRGYGASGGKMDRGSIGCNEKDFIAVSEHNARDLHAALDFLAIQPRIDAEKVLVVGASTGGYAAVSFGAFAPPNVSAVINFSGGWHMLFFSGSCTKSGLAPAFKTLGSDTHIPELWIYAKNDHLFGPKYVASVHDAFVEGGGNAELVSVERRDGEGHYLFAESPQIWGPIVEEFLQKQKLPSIALYPDPTATKVKLPPGFSADAEEAFERFLKLGPYKAFAVGPAGAWSYSSGKKTAKLAIADALDRCGRRECVVIAKDGP
jgi:pimeloyl-ACP methyl ester carboxylesterase